MLNKFIQLTKTAENKRRRKFLKKKSDNEQFTARKSKFYKSRIFSNIHVDKFEKPSFETIFFLLLIIIRRVTINSVS